MFQTTRRRLALWYTTVTAIVLLLFASGVYWYVRTTLVERVDDTLNHVVEIVQRSLVIEPGAASDEQVLTAVGKVAPALKVNVEASFRDNTTTTEDDHIDLEWFSPTGDLLWSTLSEPLNLPVKVNPEGKTVPIDAEHVVRQVTDRIVAGNQILGYLRVSHPWFEVTKPSRQLLQDLTLGLSLMISAVAFIGWLLSGIAIAPVRESYQQLKQFTADASHELRNPIAVIQTNAQVALADPEPDAIAQQQQLQVIERLTRRLGRLVDDLLFLARQEGGLVPFEAEPVDISLLLTDVIEEQSMIADHKQIQLDCQACETALVSLAGVPSAPCPPTSLPNWQVQGDADQLLRLFTNIISNSLQYTPEDGRIEISLEEEKWQNQAAIAITIKDNGVGIPEAALPHIFDRFYRVDPARQRSATSGSGLGLAIAKVIVENHGGDIQLQSRPQQGTEVKIRLPLYTEPSKSRPPLTAASRSGHP
ncbi:sensor histidine kinase [Leptolyngbya iicbica LK]|uniref:histidine kinase n=3 Tax=Cyanophyceae TaxID=3028117 RepID=A0A4Q7E9C6_9CYAN|nr:HAMP domain-containing sensor histidine kinase [Leptolyngbya sp. LK]RZM79820.1 sensor histidine kinase [Leptolyngbya sp. LK]